MGSVPESIGRFEEAMSIVIYENIKGYSTHALIISSVSRAIYENKKQYNKNLRHVEFDKYNLN